MKRMTIVLALALAALAQAADKTPPRPRKPDFVNSIGMPFVRIPAGKFLMGSPAGEWGRNRNEWPQRRVTLTRDFYMCQYETVNQWFERFIKETKYDARKKGESDFQARKYPLKPSTKPGRVEHLPEFPVIFVSWYASLRFCNWLSAKEGRPQVYVFDAKRTEGAFKLPVVHMRKPHDGGYRLPTEAEWEYAARAGTRTAFYFGPDDRKAEKHVYIDRLYVPMHKRRIPANRLPNPWGLYHMCGNAGEWCWDRYSPNYKFYATVDPTGPNEGLSRVSRDGGAGGRIGFSPAFSRSASRMLDLPTVTRWDVGFRVVLNPAKPAAPKPGK